MNRCCLPIAAVALLAAAAAAAPPPSDEDDPWVKYGTGVSSPVSVLLAHSDAVVLGEVEKIEGDTLTAVPYAGLKAEVSLRVASIKVKEAVSGAKGVGRVRVAFRDRPARTGPRPADAVEFVAAAAIYQPTPPPTAGQAGVFYLQKHPTKDVYVPTPLLPPTGLKAGAEAAEVWANVRLAADPAAGLAVADPRERLHNALRLVSRYQAARAYRAAAAADPKPVDLPAAESKLLVEALAFDFRATDPDAVAVETAISRCRLAGLDEAVRMPTLEEGDEAFERYRAARRTWMLENAGTIRLQRVDPR